MNRFLKICLISLVVARRIGTTPQYLNMRLKVGKFTTAKIKVIASALGAEYVSEFRFPDGTRI
jgi:hypothetical protein